MDVSLNAHNHDLFLEQFPLGSFLQSGFWKKFLNLQGKKSWQLNVYDKNRVLAHCLLYTNNLVLGKSYLYAPKGPLFIPTLSVNERKEALELILSQIRDITIATRRREEIFCRIEPNTPLPMLTDFPMKRITAIQPKTTIYLNLERPLDEVFSSFREKTRYNIRVAEKKGITVHWSQDESGLKYFLSLLEKSRRRNKIRSHDHHYYHLLLKADQEHNTVFINYAMFNNKPIAANMYIMRYPTMTYIHGGFNYTYRNMMAPYLLQWDAIQFAKKNNMNYYDFWGYTPSDGSKPSLSGVSRFKEGFNGIVVESPGCTDVIYNKVWYSAYQRMRSLRRTLHI